MSSKNKTLASGVVIAIALVLWIWYRFAVPVLLKIQGNFSYSADVVSKDNFYDEVNGEYKGQQLSVTKFNYEVDRKQENNLLIKNVFDVRTPTGDKIFAVERKYGIDPLTGKHVKGIGDRDREGYLFAPRFNYKKPFVYWHVNYDVPANLSYKSTEDLYGIKVERYETDYHADQTADLGFLPDVGKTKGVNLDINLKVWVEPVSGHMVKYEDATTAYYYDLVSGERIYPWNQFTNTFTEESVKAHVASARLEKIKVLTVTVVVPVVFLIFILIGMSALLLRKRTIESTTTRYTTLFLFTLLLVLCAVTTGGSWFFARESFKERLQSRFDEETEEIEQSVLTRFEIYKNALKGTEGLFAASKEVDKSGWKKYAETVNIINNYPGIKGISFAPRVFEEGVEIYPITYLEPEAGDNLLAFGYDIYSETTRRTALDRARDTGTPQITAKIELIQDKGSNIPGFLIVIPVYKNELPHTTLEEKRANIVGFVTAPIRVSEFTEGVLENRYREIGISIYDGVEVGPETVKMYSTSDIHSDSEFSKIKTVYVLGHPWTFIFGNTPELTIGTSEKLVLVSILILGSLISILILGVFYFLLNSRAKAVDYALRARQELQKSEKEMEAIINSMAEGVLVVDSDYKISLVNPAALKMLGVTNEEVLGRPWTEAVTAYKEGREIPFEERTSVVVLRTGETIVTPVDHNHFYKTKAGKNFPVDSVTAPIRSSEKIIGSVKVFRDATQERETKKQIEDKVLELEGVNKLMVDRELKMIELKKKLAAEGGKV